MPPECWPACVCVLSSTVTSSKRVRPFWSYVTLKNAAPNAFDVLPEKRVRQTSTRRSPPSTPSAPALPPLPGLPPVPMAAFAENVLSTTFTRRLTSE